MANQLFVKIGDTLIEAPKPTSTEISRARKKLSEFFSVKGLSEISFEIVRDLNLNHKEEAVIKRSGCKFLSNINDKESLNSIIVALAAGRRYHKS